MKIAVLVKQSFALDDEFELGDAAPWIDPGELESELNEWDAFAVEAALQLSEAAAGEAEVVAVSAGGDEADEALLAALAKGADRGVRVECALGTMQDPIAVAHALAPALRDEAPDLILSGVQSSDGRSGATGGALAGLLGLPRVAVARRLAFAEGETTLSVSRELEGGVLEHVAVSLPALITVQTGINEPRYANLRAIKLAERKPREVVAAGGDPANGGNVRSLRRPESASNAELFEGSPAEIARQIDEIVAAKVSA